MFIDFCRKWNKSYCCGNRCTCGKWKLKKISLWKVKLKIMNIVVESKNEKINDYCCGKWKKWLQCTTPHQVSWKGGNAFPRKPRMQPIRCFISFSIYIYIHISGSDAVITRQQALPCGQRWNNSPGVIQGYIMIPFVIQASKVKGKISFILGK